MMNLYTSWQYDEFQQIGKDYGAAVEVEAYDTSHADFRDLEAESQAVLDLLALKPGEVLIEFGCGTGTLAVQAALRGVQVDAVDVSPTMLDYARAKATQAGVAKIAFHHSGFLNYQHQGPPADAIATSLALHHLPDFWKGIALTRMQQMLKPGGQLYLYDVVIPQEQPLETIATFIHQQTVAGGEFLREDAEGHFREENSTYDWIMEGLLTRAGFTIERKISETGVFVAYHCLKVTL